MSEDKTKVEETTEEETLEENEDIEQDEDLDEQDSSEDESTEESDDEDVGEIDYKAELEEAQGRLAQQNERIAKQDKKIIKLKKKNKDEFGDEIEEDEEEDLDAKVDAKLTARMASLKEDVIDEAIDAVSTNADEAKLIRWHFDNSLNVKGFSKKEILENVSFAKAIANKGKIEIQNKIISKKIKSINSSGTKSTAGVPPVKSPKVTQYDRKMAERYFKGDIKKWLKYKT